MKAIRFLFLVLTIFTVHMGLRAGNYIHHDIDAEIFPESKEITVLDNIQLPEPSGDKHHFLLHGDLRILSVSDNIEIRELSGDIESTFSGINTATFNVPDKIPIKHYEISFKNSADTSFTIEYAGTIFHEMEQVGTEYERGFSQTPGIISEKGVYLSGSSYWLPWFNDSLITFDLRVTAPEKWHSVSQGKRITDSEADGKNICEWHSPEPMDEAYLISAEFHQYKIKQGNVNLYAYLRTPEDSLAMKYLNTTGQYLEMYNRLIGPFPYSKFALIENFWETGYGMPSFTLLGSKVIRFPFILHSSYPHELLHNWWGNSVFVNYEKGNWCEGITVYLADHLIKEQRKQGVEYRRTTLQGYTNYVNDENEFPAAEFTARYDASSSAIGYGKVMMMFHMLRQQFGDDIFRQSLQDFYRNNKFKKASFSDVRKSFETVSGTDLSAFFDQWISRKGAPKLKLENAAVTGTGDMFQLKFELIQTQPGTPYKLSIPAAVYLDGEENVKLIHLDMTEKSQSYAYTFSQKPLRIDIDPYFDVFRRLASEEIPPSLSNLLGSDSILIVLPEKDAAGNKAHYEKLAKTWASGREDSVSIISAEEIQTLPSDKDIWLFGWDNRFKHVVGEALASYDSTMRSNAVTINHEQIDRKENSIVLAVKNPENKSRMIVFVSSDNGNAFPGLGRKLPHYGKYSYLAFTGDEPTISLKGQWEAKHSPLKKTFVENAAFNQKPPVRKPLGKLAPLFSVADMQERVAYLSDPKREGRGIGTAGIDAAADYIAENFETYGLKPGADNGTFFQEWDVKTGPENAVTRLKNVIGFIPGKKESFTDQTVILAAHYDHLGRGWPDVRNGNEGEIHPGADDNASGISVLLEIAKNLGESLSPDRNILFVAFTGEENKLMGSEYFFQQYKRFPVDKIMGVVNLDTVGRLDGKKPMVIGSSSAKEWKFIFMGIGFTTGIESDLIAQDLDASDQVTFVQAGIPAIQLFSGPHLDYHKPSDTPEKLDYEGLVKIAEITKEIIVYLSEREEPMTFTGKLQTHPAEPAAEKQDARASIGIMPDFSYSAGGVKVAAAMKSPAGKDHVLMKGDIITAIGGKNVSDLRAYSAELKNYAPGQEVEITFLRSGQEMTAVITMRQR